MLKELKRNIWSTEANDNIVKEKETIKRSQTEILKLKNTITELNNSR